MLLDHRDNEVKGPTRQRLLLVENILQSSSYALLLSVGESSRSVNEEEIVQDAIALPFGRVPGAPDQQLAVS
jgi:hypothetical protein